MLSKSDSIINNKMINRKYITAVLTICIFLMNALICSFNLDLKPLSGGLKSISHVKRVNRSMIVALMSALYDLLIVC